MLEMTSLVLELRKLRTGPIGRRRKIVRVGRRLVLVSWWTDMPTVIRGHALPLLPWHRDGTSDGFPIQTLATFKISHVGSEWEGAEVQNISVVDKHQRKGWGAALVEALLVAFPANSWSVSAPNEKSTALFMKLHQRHPDRVICPPDTRFG